MLESVTSMVLMYLAGCCQSLHRVQNIYIFRQVETERRPVVEALPVAASDGRVFLSEDLIYAIRL